MAITEIFGGLFKTQNPKEKTKAERKLTTGELRLLLEQLAGNGKVLIHSSHTDGTRADGHCLVDSVKGNYVALCNKVENKYYFVELTKINRFDLNHDFQSYKSAFFYEVG
jgi:hypothetical protein